MITSKQQHQGAEKRSVNFRSNISANIIPLFNNKRLIGFIAVLIGFIAAGNLSAQVTANEASSTDKKVKAQSPATTKATSVNAPVVPVEKIIYNIDFNNGKSKLPVNPRRWKITDGSLAAYGNKMAEIYIKKLELEDFVLSCKMRLLNTPKGRSDGHCGFVMSNGKGKSVRIYFRKSNVSLLITDNKKTIKNIRLKSYSSWELSPQAKWNDIKITVKAGSATVYVNGSLLANFKFPIKMVRRINIYSYIVNCGIDDFKLTALSTPQP